MLKTSGTMIENSRRAVEALLQNSELKRLYSRAVQQYGEGELHVNILESVVQALQDEDIKEEALADNESMYSLLCGIWIQFLLVEVAGVRKENLKAMVRNIFDEDRPGRVYH